MIRTVFLAVWLVSSATGAAYACPLESLDREAIIKAITDAPTCRASFEMLSACRYNAGGDIELASIVTERCEKTFLSTLKPDAKRAYQRAQQACARKYRNKEGTMYASAQAICAAEAAVRLAK
jgi:hypothetical protein